MSIFEKLFGAAPAQPAQQPQPGNPAMQPPSGATNPTQPLPGTTPNNGVTPAPATPAQPNVQESPLDAFKDVWQTPTNTEAQPASMFANLDPAKLMENAAKVDFTKTLDPATLAQIQAGGEGATAALIATMNKVGQQVYGNSAMATAKIVEKALEQQAAQFNAQLPNLVKKLSANETLLTENPLLKNPAVAPIVTALRDQLVMKNPNATSAELAQQMGDFFTAMGTQFAPPVPQSKEQKQASARKQDDWSTFISE